MISSLKLTTNTPLRKQEVKKIKTIWQSLQDNNDSTQFRLPVDWKNMGLIDYPQIVKNPMDLSTVNRKLRENRYQTIEEVLDDIQLIWDNCKLYNQKGCWIYDLADKLERSFKRMVKNFLPQINIPSNSIGNTSTVQSKTPPTSKPQQQQILQQDKLKFTDRIKVLKPEELGQLVNKIIEVCPLAFKDVDGERAQIIVDNIDVFSWKMILETLNNLEEVEDQLSKKMKL